MHQTQINEINEAEAYSLFQALSNLLDAFQKLTLNYAVDVKNFSAVNHRIENDAIEAMSAARTALAKARG